jgi:DNA-binding NarL/FixJ family response regulator
VVRPAPPGWGRRCSCTSRCPPGDPERAAHPALPRRRPQPFSPRLAGFVLDAFRGRLAAPFDPELDQLTAREREVLRHIARGYGYEEVAQSLHLSARTVETHVSAVLRTLQLSSRHELARWASDRCPV